MRTILQFSFPGQQIPFNLESEDFTVIHCSKMEDIHRLVKLNRIELLFYINDTRINDFSEIKEIESLTDIPCIVFGHDNKSETSLKFLREGSDFYISLNSSEEEYFSTCMKHIENSLSRIERLAYRDPLTGAFNRRFYDVVSSIEVERAQMNRMPLSIALLDIDRFKQINDSYGHDFGDEVLGGFVGCLERVKRKTDHLIRLGGEEFVLIMPGVNITEAGAAMNEILKEIQITPVAYQKQVPFYITFSSGVAEWNRTTISEWLKTSDMRLYEAKKRGRNRIETGEGDETRSNISDQSLLVIAQTEDGKKYYQSLFKNDVKTIYVAGTYSETLAQLKDSEEVFDMLIIEDLLGKGDFAVIKSISDNYEIPIFMIYPHKHPQMSDIINAGIDDFIVQPYGEEDVYYKVVTLLSSKKEKSK